MRKMGNKLLLLSMALLITVTRILVGGSSATVPQGPVFIKEPPDEIDFSNTTGVSLHCVARGIPAPKISWIRSDNVGKLLENVTDLRNSFPNGTLHFLPFRAEIYRQDVHATVYRCIATNPLGTILSREVKIRAAVKQNYDANVYDEFVIRYNTAVIKCHIPSFVKDDVIVTSWLVDDGKSGQRTIQSEGRFSVFPSGALHIRDVNIDDGRKYKCVTKHVLTQETKTSASFGQLIVTSPQSSVAARLTDHIANLEVVQNKNVELPCASQGFPNPQYKWWKIKHGKRESIKLGSRIEQKSGSLFIHGVHINDEGTYVCETNNSLNNEQTETVLNVFVPLSAFIHPSTIQIDVGKSANLTCSTTGYPIVSVEWLKDGNRVANSERLTFPTPEILRIETVQREDKGMYQCFIRNKVASAQASAELKLGDAMPTFHENFASKIYQRGARVFLKCSVYGIPSPQVSWTQDGFPLNTSKYVIEELLSSQGEVISYVNISNINVEDGGEFACAGKNRVGKIEHRAKIDVYGSPFIRQTPNITAVTGESKKLKCSSSGHPILGLTWERDGNQLPINHRQKVFPNGTLLLEYLEKPGDEGWYMCQARNHFGEIARRSFFVTLITAPTISPFQFPVNLREGMRAGITCFITDGDLPITIEWLKDGGPIVSHLDVTTNTLHEFTSTLSINSINPRNNGNYTCVAKNAAATVNHTAQLLVNVPPRWTIAPLDANVTEGKSVYLNCLAEGFPNPNVGWKKRTGDGIGDYRPIHYLEKEISIANNGSLLIASAEESHEGHYLCQANNGIGSGLSKLVFLKVHIPAKFELRRSNENARKGTTTKLVCEVKGDSPLIIAWKKNDTVIDQHQDPRVTFKESITMNRKTSELILHKTDRSDHAQFTCEARNNYGSDKMIIDLIVFERPEVPKNVSIGKKSSRSVELRWEAPFDGNNPIRRYKYQYKVATANAWNHNEASISYTNENAWSAIVSSLVPASRYHFRLAAENDIGTSNYSETVTANTLEEAPGGPPLSIAVEAINSQALRVLFKAPKIELRHGEIKSYRIGYRLLDASEYTFVTATEKPKESSHEYILTDLKKFSKYGIVISAYNNMGAGPLSTEIVHSTMEDLPTSAPSDLRCSPTSSTSLKVTWTPPPAPTLNGILLGYKVNYAEVKPTPNPEKREIKRSVTTNINLEGLEAYTNYSVKVGAFNKAGDGVWSKHKYCRTDEDVPGSPKDIKTLVMSSDAVMVSWQPPAEPNGKLIKYTVYMKNKQSEKLVNYSLLPRDQTFEARGLKEDNQYQFWVTASTAIGEGTPSKIMSLSPLSTVPAKIGSFSERMAVARRTDVKLPCRAVGIPTPERDWMQNELKLSSTNRLIVWTDGTLEIKQFQSADVGNYTCRVENIYAVDQIVYEVKLKPNAETIAMPPNAPVIKTMNATKFSLTLAWKLDDDGGSAIIDYILNYKSDGSGAWSKVSVPNENSTYTLTNLSCGTRYHVFVSARNKEGVSSSSNVEIVSTKGSVPIAPPQDTLFVINRKQLNIHLDTWTENECQIQSFTIEYRHKGDYDWKTAAQNLSPIQKIFALQDFQQNTSYTLRVTVNSEAGVKTDEYLISANYNSKGLSPSTVPMEERSVQIPFYFNLNIIIPVVVSIIVIIVITATLCDFLRRRPQGFPIRKQSLPRFLDSQELDKRHPHDGLQGPPHYSPSRTDSGVQDDICPYATYQLPECLPPTVDDDNIPMKSFGQMNSSNSTQIQSSISPSGKPMYSKVKKGRPSSMSEWQQYPNLTSALEPNSPCVEQRGYINRNCELTSREILRKQSYVESASKILPSAPPAEYDLETDDDRTCSIKMKSDGEFSDNESSEMEVKPQTTTFHKVPDLLYHRSSQTASYDEKPSSWSDSKGTGSRHTGRHRNKKKSKRASKVSKTASKRTNTELSESEPETSHYHSYNNTLGPPVEFTDCSASSGNGSSPSHHQISRDTKHNSNVPGKKSADEVATRHDPTGDGKDAIDPVRLAAAEEELIALLKRSSTSPSSTPHFRSSKDDFTVRV